MMQRKYSLDQIFKITVDVHLHPATVIVPREAGLLHFGVRSTYILGLQIGTQFCPGFIAPQIAKADERSETRLSFFCRLKYT